jgi:hypothetical protein
LADSSQERSRPRRRADSIEHGIGLGIEEYFKDLFTGLRVVRERSVCEPESGVIMHTTDAVDDAAAVQGPEA